MKLEQAMTRTPATCSHRTSLNEAAQLMWELDIGCVPVTGDDKRLIGMITDRDICMASYTQGGSLSDLTVDSAMQKAVWSCGVEDSIRSVATKMRERHVRRIPVVDSGRVVGIVSLSDLARAAANSPNGMTLSQVGETLAAVCQRRSRQGE